MTIADSSEMKTDVRTAAVCTLNIETIRKYAKSGDLGIHPVDRDYIKNNIHNSISVTFEIPQIW